MNKPVALIILNYNTAAHTGNCISSFLTYCDTTLFDVIIADNGSTDHSPEILMQQFPDAVFIDNKENLGFAEGNNRALQYSIDNNYEYALLTNSDTLVNSDIVTILKAHLNLNTKVAAVQPAIFWLHKPTELWNGAGYFNRLAGNTISKTAQRYQLHMAPLTVDWVTGCCVMLKNSALQRSGLFNRLFFLYYEDADLSFRLRANNYQLHYLPEAKIYHEAGVSGKKRTAEGVVNPIIHYYKTRNHLWFIRRYGATFLKPINLVYNLGYYGLLLIYLIVRKRGEKTRLLLRGIKDGLFTPLNTIWPEA